MKTSTKVLLHHLNGNDGDDDDDLVFPIFICPFFSVSYKPKFRKNKKNKNLSFVHRWY